MLTLDTSCTERAVFSGVFMVFPNPYFHGLFVLNWSFYVGASFRNVFAVWTAFPVAFQCAFKLLLFFLFFLNSTDNFKCILLQFNPRDVLLMYMKPVLFQH
uniref:Uncharacterized protein n=1 Tax=Anguilla anguilla TaxID=7936 RepID=A0A0E9WKG1_ANGAN